MPETLTITPCLYNPEDMHSAMRAEISRLDARSWRARNASLLSKENCAHIERLERRAAHLRAKLPETKRARTARLLKTEAKRRAFARGQALYEKRQAKQIEDARIALAALSDPALPAALHKQITTLIGDIERHQLSMTEFNPSQGIPEAMLALLPLSER